MFVLAPKAGRVGQQGADPFLSGIGCWCEAGAMRSSHVEAPPYRFESWRDASLVPLWLMVCGT